MRWFVKWLVLCSLCCAVAGQNCRGEEPRQRDCENICDSYGNCKIRAALLLPKNTTYDASLSSVEPVFDLALQSKAVQDALPDWLDFEWTTYDVTDCDAAYAIISAIDAYTYDCAQVFFGPACDYALASVARIAKFLGNSGTPIMTTGGFTFDFVEPKLTCDREFYMLLRTGMMGFKDVAYFIINVMRHFDWRQLLLITEPDGQVHVAGKSTCHLMIKTFANYLKIEEILYTPWDTTSDGGLNYTENLKFYLGNKYTSWGRIALLYETHAFAESVGNSGGFLMASTLHQYLLNEGVSALGREVFSSEAFESVLLQTVGNDYAKRNLDSEALDFIQSLGNLILQGDFKGISITFRGHC